MLPIKRRNYKLRDVACPKCGKPVRIIRHDRYGVCLKCHNIFDVPDLSAEIIADACAHFDTDTMRDAYVRSQHLQDTFFGIRSDDDAG